jgi:hypothetical protein
MGVLLLGCVLAVAADEPPASVALVLQGTRVELQRGKKRASPLRPNALLRPGDRLKAATDGTAVLVFLADGHRERLRPGQEATVGEKGCRPEKAVELLPVPALAPANLEALRDLCRSARAGIGVPRGNPPEAPPHVRPLHGAAVATTRPELSWPAEDKAEGYRLEMLSGAEGREQRRPWQATTKAPHLAYPEKEKPLDTGKRYRWRVRPLHGEEAGEPIVQSQFQVLTEEEIQDLAEVKRLVDSKAPEDWLEAAALYEAHGIHDEVLRLYERLARARPEEPAFQRALANYYARAGRPDLARAARERANKLGWQEGGKD